ncbi:hypothetical protein AB0J71_41030 [Nonomuraea sp. NPDC049637]|uniref:hypothetical protein n=1 Tax=Nonomuraea sp. NPDC049637 TaxID=3154356 RepID=UPI003425CF91
MDLLDRHGLPKETYRNLYEEESILVPGPATVTGELSRRPARAHAVGRRANGSRSPLPC